MQTKGSNDRAVDDASPRKFSNFRDSHYSFISEPFGTRNEERAKFFV